jgi:hypothetical protein
MPPALKAEYEAKCMLFKGLSFEDFRLKTANLVPSVKDPAHTGEIKPSYYQSTR